MSGTTVQFQFTQEVQVEQDVEVKVECSKCGDDLSINSEDAGEDYLNLSVDSCNCGRDLEDVTVTVCCNECGGELDVTDTSHDDDSIDVNVAPCGNCSKKETETVWMVLGPWGLMPFVFATEAAALNYADRKARALLQGADDVFPRTVFAVAPFPIIKE
jgi:hypothetical protein